VSAIRKIIKTKIFYFKPNEITTMQRKINEWLYGINADDFITATQSEHMLNDKNGPMMVYTIWYKGREH
jgi:hypothetical protein